MGPPEGVGGASVWGWQGQGTATSQLAWVMADGLLLSLPCFGGDGCTSAKDEPLPLSIGFALRGWRHLVYPLPGKSQGLEKCPPVHEVPGARTAHRARPRECFQFPYS